MSIDYRAAQQASRRVGGLKFRLAQTPRPRRVAQHTRLTWTSVREIRAWAAGEGWGRTMAEQSRVLGARYGVGACTVMDVIRNLSWHDPAYVPGRPDPAVWRGVAPTVALLRLLGEARG